jgi:PAS domain S-box-containing protein
MTRSDLLLQTRYDLGRLAETHTVIGFLQQTLDEAEKLTGSEIGFAHFLKPDQETLELQTWSTNTLLKMCTAEGEGKHYPIKKAGVWVDCFYTRTPVVHNNYTGLAHRKGLPEGHAPIIREMLVPVIQGDLVVAIFGVGNKPSDYTKEDVELFSQLAQLIWDIVRRKRTEEELVRKELWYRTIFDMSPSGVLLEDLEGNIVDFNPAFCKSVGYSREELEGANIRMLVPEGFRTEISDHINKIRHGTALLHTVKNVKKDGTPCWMELHETMVRLPDGRKGILVVSNDITERVNAEEQLRLAKLKAEESSRLKSAFLANMSHEIRTPMGGIVGFLGLLQEKNLSEKERLQLTDMMNEPVYRLLDTVNSILDMSNIQTGKIELFTEEIEIVELLDTLWRNYKPRAEDKALVFIKSHNQLTKPFMIRSDRSKIEAILTAFIKNAIKFTRKGGIEIGVKLKGSELVFHVRDSGIGIPADREEAIFEPFTHADMSITRGHEGAGLGLAIARAYSQALDGHIKVDSTPGKGSTFFFSLPFIPAH